MKKILVLLSALAVTGCAALDGKQRKLDVADGSGVSFDITRRAILAGKLDEVVRGADGNPLKDGSSNLVTLSRPVVCAEPSPDGMSTFASQLAASYNLTGAQAIELAGSVQESGAFVGLRTQSIQLLRDAMFRSCEAYMSGGIDKNAYDLLLRRHQRYMLALLSIEALTGTIKAPTVTISTESMASAAKSLSALRDENKAIDGKIDTATKTKKEHTDALAALPATATEEDKKKIQDKIDASDKEIKLYQSDKKNIETAIQNANGLLTTGKTTVAVSDVGITSARSDAHLKKVAETVKSITENLLNSDDFSAKCLDFLAGASEKQTKSEFGVLCMLKLANVPSLRGNGNDQDHVKMAWNNPEMAREVLVGIITGSKAEDQMTEKVREMDEALRKLLGAETQGSSE